MNLAIIGCGQVAAWRIKHIGAERRLSVVATVDPIPERAASVAASFRKHGHKPVCFSTAREAMDGVALDLAYIATPNGLHRDCAQPFIEAEIAVVIEKPLALAGRSIEWLAEREQLGAWICGAYNSRFSPGVSEAVGKTRGHKIVTIASKKTRSRPPDYYADGWHGTWALDGGVLAQQAVHCIDLVCWAAGDRSPSRVAALGFNRRHEIECEDTGTILMDFGTFAATVWGTTAAGRNGKAAIEIATTDGVYETEDWVWDDGARPLWHLIAEAIENGVGPPVPVSSTLPGLKTLHAAYLSMDRAGDWVELGEWHPRLGVPAPLAGQ
jgi:UDP-N-acetyl-2-amino-2-deoxyglucuronate dehydrogenase